MKKLLLSLLLPVTVLFTFHGFATTLSHRISIKSQDTNKLAPVTCRQTISVEDANGKKVGNALITTDSFSSIRKSNAKAVQEIFCPNQCKPDTTYYLTNKNINCTNTNKPGEPVNKFYSTLNKNYFTSDSNSFTVKQKIVFTQDMENFQTITPTKGTISFSVKNAY